MATGGSKSETSVATLAPETNGQNSAELRTRPLGRGRLHCSSVRERIHAVFDRN